MAGDRAEKAILEYQVSLEQNLALLVLAVLFVCAHVSVEAGRAQFALEAHRRSAIRAWWRGVRLVWAKPLAAIGTYLLISLVGLAVIAVLGLLRINLPHAAFPGFVVALVLTELIAIATVWMRIARLLVLIQIGRSRPTGLPNEVRT
jgi:hypothetical protein